MLDDLTTHKLTCAQSKEALRAIEKKCRKICMMEKRSPDTRLTTYARLPEQYKRKWDLAEEIVWLIVGIENSAR